MKHFVLSAPPGEGGIIRLYEKDYHYLVRVRRLKSGMSFDAILPGGTETKVLILSTRDNILIGQCHLQCLEEGKPQPEKPFQTGSPIPPGSLLPPIALFQGLPRGAKMDLIVRQAAEAGVSVVTPFKSEYSTPLMGAPLKGGEKIKRWERIIKEARQQSGSVTETRVLPPCGFDAMLDYWESLKKKYSRPVGILLHQEPLEKGTFHGYLGNDPDFVVLAVGPEGGFSPGELTQFLKTGFRPLLMGNTILRTETAALYGIAAIRIILLESEAWTAAPTELCSSKSRLT